MQCVLQRRRERQYVMTSICEVVCASDRVLWPIDTVCISKQGNGVITMSGITMQCSLCILRVFTLITTSLSMLESKIVSLKNMLLTDIHNWSLWSMISPSSLLLGSNLRPLPFKCLVCHQKCPILASCCLFACLFVGKLSVISCLFVCLRVLKQSRAFTVLLPCLPLLARCHGTESANIKCNQACVLA